jgi:plastocyanin
MKKQFLVLVFLLAVFSLSMVVATSRAQSSTVQVTIYAGEVSTSQYGYGNSSSTIISPGPTLTFHSGDVVNLTLHNAGTMAHNWAIVDQKSSSATVLWSAQVGTPNTPVAAGENKSVMFTVGNAGNYYYICQVDAHVSLGMWGNVVVEPAIPEFPAPLLILFLAAAITVIVAYSGRGRLNIKRSLKF